MRALDLSDRFGMTIAWRESQGRGPGTSDTDELAKVEERRRQLEESKQNGPFKSVPPTPEEWVEIDRKRAELQEYLRQLGRTYDTNLGDE